jgi:hypothetical protein
MRATGAWIASIPRKQLIRRHGGHGSPKSGEADRTDQRGLMMFRIQVTLATPDVSPYQPPCLRDKAKTESVAVVKLEWYDDVDSYFEGPASNTRSSAAGATYPIF